MTEWHIFTIDGEEYTGPKCSLLYKEFVALVRTGRSHIFEESFWGLRKRDYYKDFTIVDYMIPLSQVKRIERWDTEAKDPLLKEGKDHE